MQATLTHDAHTVPVTALTFEETIRQPGVVVLDCSAPWCPPCRVFAPVFAAAAARRPELTFGTIDTDEHPSLAVALDVRAQPTIVVFKDGALIYKHVGAMSAARFDQLLDRVTAA
jgi:thioredoxin